jgi:Tfp pilus assembly protein PilF
MRSYFAVVFTDLVRHSFVWNRVPRTAMTTIIAEYRYLAQSIASQYGSRYENFTGDGHLFLFESADVAAHFGLKVLAYWKHRRRSLLSVHKAPDLPIRVGCHFGECSQLAGADAWIGRAINIAKRVEEAAEPDSLFITETILELVDLPFYQFGEAGLHDLKGDLLPRRQLYRLLSIDHAALAERPPEEMSAEDWFLKAVGMVDRVSCSPEEEIKCYQNAIRLRPNFPEAHNNIAILLKTVGERHDDVHRHYQEALRLWPEYPEAHFNYAIFLETVNDQLGAMKHYAQAIKHCPDYTDARLRYASLLAALGHETDADRQYQEALRLRPGYAEAHNNYGVFLEHRGESSAAEQQYLVALELRPDYAEAHYNYAMLLESTNPAKAEEEYHAALQASADYAEAHNNLAVLLYEKGDMKGAEKHYSAALRLRPHDMEIRHNFDLLVQAKRDEQAEDQHLHLPNGLAPKSPSVD